jgi:arylsulfatase A-like enzyme
VLLYGASWTEFWNIGVFLDRQAFLFWLPHPVQVFHWIYPPLAVGVVAATLAAAAILAWWIPRAVAAMRPAVQRRLVMTAACAAGVCVVAAAAGQVAHGASAQGGLNRSSYLVARDEHSAPLVHALADLLGSATPSATPSSIAQQDASRVIRRPIISMDQYLAGVDRSRVKPWNVLMIQVESLRSDQLRAYGGTRDVMPTLDALARESAVFTNAYIQASHSNYADLVPLSSQYPLRSGEVYTYPPNPPYPRVLIYGVLKALGYKTAIFSSQNENWGGMINFHRPDRLDRFFHAATFDGPTYAPWGDISFAEWVKETKGAGSVDDRYTVDAATEWLDTVGSTPFFLHMNLQSSHVPYVVPDDFPRRFGPKTLDFTIMWGKFPRDRINVVKDRYADSLFYEDTQIARLFEHLRRRGLWNNTVIVIGGDNGEAFYEHGFASHATALFNEVMKVPMIIRVPGRAPRPHVRPAMFLDIPPTVLDLLGLPAHPGFQGISLFEPSPDPARSIYMIAQTPVVHESAIVRSGFKLLFAERSGNTYLGRYLLFDTVKDPGEQVDVAASQPRLFDDLSRRLQLWRGEQLNYYSDLGRQAREYPPVVRD